MLEIWDLFVIWCLEFVILDTKLLDRTIFLQCGTDLAHRKPCIAGKEQVFNGGDGRIWIIGSNFLEVKKG